MEVPQPKSSLYQVDGYRSCGSEDITFLLCHVAARDHTIKGTSLILIVPVEVKICFEFFVRPNKELFFKKFTHLFH